MTNTTNTDFVLDNPYEGFKEMNALINSIQILTGPIFTPRKHPIMTWAKQRKNAKARRNNMQKHRK